MQWIKTVAAGISGLFVDDGNYALTILIWVVIAGVVLPQVDIPTAIKGPILFGGLAAILFWSAARRARR